MKENIEELRASVERTEMAGLKFIATRVENARAALDYIVSLEQWRASRAQRTDSESGELSRHLRAIAEDPMYANHVHTKKSTLIAAADEIDRLAAAPAAGQAGLAKLEVLTAKEIASRPLFGGLEFVRKADVQALLAAPVAAQSDIPANTPAAFAKRYTALLTENVRLEKRIAELESTAQVAADTEQAIPEGYKLVPIEPTPEMKAAGKVALTAGCFPSGIYKDMIAAAPLATPADAGAGLTVKTWQERSDITRKPEGQVERAMAAEIADLREVLARMSTPGAQVTASDDSTIAPFSTDEQKAFQHWIFNGAPKDTAVGMAWRGWEARAKLSGSPAPVTAEPVISELRNVLDAFEDGDVQTARNIINSLIAATPAPADRDAMRAAWQVLLDAGVCPGLAPMSLAEGIRAALKSMGRAADAAETRDAKGGA